ncbi:MAG: YjjG family noncanonical pyrimidine nucleotidase [Clostridia bacterium]|nr:YjjG family noncanonical pyrimidine nucleotidase [Clostridia bacterium]
MERFGILLWDIDNTLLDFFEAERCAIRRCFSAFGFPSCSDEMVREYSGINTSYWKRLERGEITKRQVLVGRFEEFFSRHGMRTDEASAFNDMYQVALGDTAVFMDGAEEILRLCKGRMRQYGVTNGTKIAQDLKVKRSGLDELLDGIFISETVGYEKPSPDFFRAVFNAIGVAEGDLDSVLLIGDSLTSDIAGANKAGIRSCWYNPWGRKNGGEAVPDHEVSSFEQLKGILFQGE